MIFGPKTIKSLIITLVDEKDKVVSEYDVNISHLGMEPEIVEDFIEALFKGNWVE